jgi:hypothetical protein
MPTQPEGTRLHYLEMQLMHQLHADEHCFTMFLSQHAVLLLDNITTIWQPGVMIPVTVTVSAHQETFSLCIN